MKLPQISTSFDIRERQASKIIGPAFRCIATVTIKIKITGTEAVTVTEFSHLGSIPSTIFIGYLFVVPLVLEVEKSTVCEYPVVASDLPVYSTIYEVSHQLVSYEWTSQDEII